MRAERGPDDVDQLVRSLAPQVLAELGSAPGGLRRGRGCRAGRDRRGSPGLARASAARPTGVAHDRCHATPDRRPAQRVGAAAPRGDDRPARRARAPPKQGDDTLLLLFWCCHPDLSPASQVALTLRAVGGLSTREIADAFFVPEATMAQRISRAKRTLRGRDFTEPGDLAVVLRVLSLVYHAGHGRRNDLAGEAIRLTRQLTLATTEPEARGLLALMLLQHARLPARTDAAGRFVPLDEQDRSRWDTAEIAEGVAILQGALGRAAPRPLPDPGGDRCAPCRRHDIAGDRLVADPRVVRRAHRPERRTRSRGSRRRCSTVRSPSDTSSVAAAGLAETERVARRAR